MNNTQQAASAVIMIRPHHFCPNPQTLVDNAFQKNNVNHCAEKIKAKAFAEVDAAARLLRLHGVRVHVFDDESEQTPDAVFPNNWFTTHDNGVLGLYPMFCENRRKEINPQIIQYLKDEYQVNQVIDYADWVNHGLYLEGTGAMVLDHVNRYAFAVKSNRMSEQLLNRFCLDVNYQPVAFEASDENNRAIYHTNVLMCIGTSFSLIASSLIKSQTERHNVLESLQQNNKEVIDLTLEQIKHFAGNALELATPNGNILVISKTAYHRLKASQLSKIEKYLTIVPVDVTTIELAGGSIRCMLADIHLKAKG